MVKGIYNQIYGNNVAALAQSIVNKSINPWNILVGVYGSLLRQGADFVRTLNSHQFRYYLDINVLGGKGYFTNSGSDVIPVGGKTEYLYEAPIDEALTQDEYDFDGDDISEKSVLGKIEVDDAGESQFTACGVTAQDATHQGIYLSGGGKQPGDPCDPLNTVVPDLIRLADKAADFRHQGLLKTITEEDFKDTDLYVFRESTGMLITERQGLKDSEYVMHDTGG